MSIIRNTNRSMICSQNGMVASSQPLAVQAGIDILKKGGNAIDAAIAVASTLNIVEPMSTGIGGDAFALIYKQADDKLYGLNASGWSPKNRTIDYFEEKGLEKIPNVGIESVTVPGAISGFAKAIKRFGKLRLEEVFQPAIHYGKNGFPVSELVSFYWHLAEEKLSKHPATKKNYLPKGRAPKVGEITYAKDLAKTFEIIGEKGGREFYEGDIAKKIVNYTKKKGGLFTPEDFAAFEAEWVDPISSNYKKYEIFECPPNGQGIATLLALNILKGFDISEMRHNSPQYLHLLIEAKKLAWADLRSFVADPKFNDLPIDELLSDRYSEQQQNRINLNKAAKNVKPGLDWDSGDTVYLTVVDKERNAVSFINSLYNGFGSGLVVEGTGICLQNRGSLFSLDRNHLNKLEPRKRPFHTIIPAMVFEEDKPILSFGVMGGDMQPQGQMQVFLNMVEFGMNVQQAIEAPRSRHYDTNEVALETGIDQQTKFQLQMKGHPVKESSLQFFGGAQAIALDYEKNVLYGGSDPRRDGCAIGW
ncbi:MAG: gamma-glutamyltransferase [Asgard group archaeon]|nr:gamma-glutamyltransferase [Asgard group archaeon]